MNAYKLKNIIFLSLAVYCALFFMASSMSHAAEGDYEIKFGKMRFTPQGTVELLEATTEFENNPDSTQGIMYGAFIKKRQGGKFTANFVHKIPSRLLRYRDQKGKAVLSFDRQNITTVPTKHKDYAFEILNLEKSDPAGDYEMEIYVDYQLIQTIKYKVMKPWKVQVPGKQAGSYKYGY